MLIWGFGVNNNILLVTGVHLAEMTLPLSPMVKLAFKERSEVTCSSLPVICRRNQEGYQD